jgi:eukaryotic-like serine/threonine-protein kinase
MLSFPMGESSGAQVAGPPSTDSLDSLICAVADAPARVPPESGAYASPFAEGVEVGRYRLVHKLGRGGMGSVWEAAHRVTGKRVALKIVREGVALTPQLKRRFEQEARLVTAVGHPGVVEVHDIFEAPGGWPVLVMDVLSGETLGSWLGGGRRSLPEAASLLAEVVAIVSAAHRAGVVHRDLKPENIFICNSSHAPPRVRVLDFGIARLVKEPAVAPAEPLTETGTLLGTPQYMAPEQLLGERDVDERADVWALGAILYECLMGRRPIAGDNIGQVVHNLNEHGVPGLDPSEFPEAIVRAARAMLERDRRKRAADLSPVESILRRAARGELGAPRPWARIASKSLRAASLVVGAGVLCAVAFAVMATNRAAPQVSSAAATAAPSTHAPVTPPRELTMATVVARSSTTGRVLDVWQRSLSARMAGKIAFAVRFPGSNGLRGGERSVVSRLRTGQVDGAMLSSRALPSISASAAAMELPGVVDSWAKVDWVRGQLRETLQAGFAAEGYHLLSWHDEGCQRIMSRGRPVRRVLDLARRRIAAFDTDPFSNTLFSLVPGAVPVPLAESDVSVSLRDGSRLGVSAIVASAGEAERAGWVGSLEHVTMIPIACTSGAVVLARSTYERLPEEIRATVDDVSARAEEAAAPHARKEDTTASLRLARTLAPIDPSAAERREWQRLFASAASRFTQSGVPPSLAEQAMSLGKEIDALK